MESIENIYCAAVQLQVTKRIFSMAPPARHHNIMHDFNVMGYGQQYMQGFLTNTRRFVDREEAVKIARASRQIYPGMPKKTQPDHLLFSEDLW